jgi:uncharacterized protein with HEPN domain
LKRGLRLTVEREPSIVGEAAGQATRYFPDLKASLEPVRQIVGFRNRIIYEYAEIDPDIVWAIVQGEVPDCSSGPRPYWKRPDRRDGRASITA